MTDSQHDQWRDWSTEAASDDPNTDADLPPRLEARGRWIISPWFTELPYQWERRQQAATAGPDIIPQGGTGESPVIECGRQRPRVDLAQELHEAAVDRAGLATQVGSSWPSNSTAVQSPGWHVP